MASAGGTRGTFLPPDPRVDEPFRLTPQAALRVAILGGIALVVFGALFLRLWALEVLSGQQYLRVAQNNQLRSVRLEAPRGAIRDRNGKLLVGNRPSTAVQLWPSDLPDKWYLRLGELRLLSQALDVPIKEMTTEIARRKGDPLTPVTIKESARRDEVNYLLEHRDKFPGLRIADSYVRMYPQGSVAAQLYGYVTEVSPEQLKRKPIGIKAGDKIGQSGIEGAFDGYLRGEAGAQQLRVDALGTPRGQPTPLPRTAPGQRPAAHDRPSASESGAARPCVRHPARARLELLRVLGRERRRDRRARPARRLGSRDGVGADVPAERLRRARHDQGARGARADVGHGSREELSRAEPGARRRVSARVDLQVGHRDRRAPGASRLGVDAPGLHRHVHLSGGPRAPGVRQLGSLRQPGDGSADGARGVVRHVLLPTRQRLLRVPPERGHPLQAWASRLGFGRPTGIDVGPEYGGLLPTPEWRQRHFKTALDKLWKPGDSIQLAIGQKDLLVTPMQMARFYALVANGGKLVTPHLLLGVQQTGSGGAAPHPAAPAAQQINIDPGGARRRAPRVARGDARLVRHLVCDLRQLPRRRRGQDRNR